MIASLLPGDCRDVMRGLANASVDAVVCDPPYELGFMGKKWDASGVAFDPKTWSEALRIAKPGAYLLAFGGSRTFHRMACAIEDAGWEIRDTIMWLYGSGFPKSRNLGDGRGTALKPAHEPIIMARKPLVGTLAANVLAYGTGALNIDMCRVPGEPMPPNTGAGGLPRRTVDEVRGVGVVSQPHALGRWPANVIHDGSEEVLAAFPDAPGQQGDLKGHSRDRLSRGVYGDMRAARNAVARVDAETSAARFFYCAKASRRDRDQGCDGLPLRHGGMVSNTSGQHITRRDGGAPGPVRNHHPTVKPTELMRYLCRLVTPRGGTVLDPFCGSGSTGKAAALEWINFIGIELNAEYIEIAERRIAHARKVAA